MEKSPRSVRSTIWRTYLLAFLSVTISYHPSCNQIYLHFQIMWYTTFSEETPNDISSNDKKKKNQVCVISVTFS
jgi:hypothetical protein